MKRLLVISVVSTAVAVIIGGVLILSSGRAGAVRPPFVPIPAAANIAALSSPPMLGTPPAVGRLSPDLRAADTPIYALGTAGYAWQRGDGNVCVLMASGPGGCLSSFNKPVLLFLTATRPSDGSSLGSQRASGLAPDAIKHLVLVTTDGDRITAPISRNAFAVEVPANAGIAGEFVTLANGTSFWNQDRVTLPLAGGLG
jgi:hypothetical protein